MKNLVNTLESIFSALGLKKENGLFKCGDNLPEYPLRILSSLDAIDYDAIFNVENKPLIIFKDLTYVNEDVEEEISRIHRNVWNFGETPLLFIVLEHEIRIYNGFVFDKEKNEAWKVISDISPELEEFSSINLISGKFWKEHENKFTKQTRVHDYLLKNLKTCREILQTQGLPSHIINNLLGRLIFSRYLIDRSILDPNFFLENYNKEFEDLIKDKTKLYNYFNFLRSKFNGDMFPLDKFEAELINEKSLNVLSRLFKGDDIDKKQSVLFDVYDFSIIPIELISNIYETFLRKENLNSNKSYYTPSFLVDYILKNTLDKKLNEYDCKILDPACGSGIFLVESLRKLIGKKKSLLDRNLTNEELNDIVKKNIFGIDLDEDAINISIFSIYLTLLDYIDPNAIEKFKFPELKNTNLFVANFFDENHKFNKLIPKIDVVIGNPPWGKFSGIHINYAKERAIPISNKEISLCFIHRSGEFCHNKSLVSLIITSNAFYNLREANFRKYFLKNFLIYQILELSAVRREVFVNAIGPGSIIFYRPSFGEKTSDNIIKYISLKQNRYYKLFRAIVIEKFDVKKIQQSFFIEYDWLWKVVLFGNVHDFQLIKKLKDNFKTFEEIIGDTSIIHGVGLQSTPSNQPKDASILIGKKYLKTKNLERYYISQEKISVFKKSKVHRIRNTELFKPPHLLIRVTLDHLYKCIAAFSDEELIFEHSVQSIKGDEREKKFLMNFLGLLNSELFSYYMFMTGSTVGIERPQIRSEELLTFPTCKNLKIDKIVEELINIIKETNLENSYNSRRILEKKMNDLILDSYKLKDYERDLIEYATNISIPMRTGSVLPFESPKDEILEDYAKIYIEHFKNETANNEFFLTDIYRTEYFIAMNFKFTSEKSKTPIKFLQNESINEIISKIGYTSLNKFTERLFILRDIKGFDKNSFYVIKPNEYKNWHKAIARSDLNEFLDAILKSGLKQIGEHNDV